MFNSTNASYLALKLGLAGVFLWFGIDKFVHPAYWLSAWVPGWFQIFLAKFNLSGLQFVYINGIFEMLVGLSLLANIFTKFFAAVGIIFLAVLMFEYGLTETTIRNIGLAGALFAILFWPSARRRF